MLLSGDMTQLHLKKLIFRCTVCFLELRKIKSLCNRYFPLLSYFSFLFSNVLSVCILNIFFLFNHFLNSGWNLNSILIPLLRQDFRNSFFWETYISPEAFSGRYICKMGFPSVFYSARSEMWFFFRCLPQFVIEMFLWQSSYEYESNFCSRVRIFASVLLLSKAFVTFRYHRKYSRYLGADVTLFFSGGL